MRVIRRLAQDNPPELLAISIGNLKRFTDKIREDILLRISGLYPNLQIRPESAISHETYFENNHGHQEPAKLLLKPIQATYSTTIYDGFLTKNVKSPYVVPNRRFKSARFEVDKQKSMFDQQSKDDSLSNSSSTQYELGSIFKDLSPNQVNEHIKTRTKKIDSLQPEEQEKLDLGKIREHSHMTSDDFWVFLTYLSTLIRYFTTYSYNSIIRPGRSTAWTFDF